MKSNPLVIRTVGCTHVRLEACKSLAAVVVDKSLQTSKLLLTVDKLLLLLGANANEVGAELLTALLSLRPGIPLCKMEVTAALEVQPALRTTWNNYTDMQT